jgi:hypothetical protein
MRTNPPRHWLVKVQNGLEADTDIINKEKAIATSTLRPPEVAAWMCAIKVITIYRELGKAADRLIGIRCYYAGDEIRSDATIISESHRCTSPLRGACTYRTTLVSKLPGPIVGSFAVYISSWCATF